MGDCAPSFNPLSKLNKHVNNSKSFLQNQLNNQQQQIQHQQQLQYQQQQQKQWSRQPLMSSRNASSQSLKTLNESLSSVSLNSNSWHQEYQSNRSQGSSLWQHDIQGNKSQYQRSASPRSIESTPFSQQRNSYQHLNNMLQAPTQSRMAMMNIMMPNQMQDSLNSVQELNQQALKEELENKWESEFAKHEELIQEIESQESTNIQENQYKDKYEQIWEDLTRYSDLLRRQSDYIFVQDEVNSFKHIDNPYEAGMEILKQGGKLSEAVLCFEAAVEQQPNFVEAWMQLGLCQTKNEMEWQGITALEKALELQKENQPGTLNHSDENGRVVDTTVELGTCYINTGMDLMAFRLFDQWLHQNYDRWLSGFPAVEEKLNSDALLHGEEVSINKRVLAMFDFVASQNPLASQDKSFQVITGLLNYCIDNYDLTVFSFQKALELDTQDEVLWNRLGATLANHGKPEDAVHAYRQALAIKPSFVRGRYNLAISLMNIGWFKESVECLLACLKLQTTENDTPQNRDKNSSIVEGLSKVFKLMNRVDLLDKLKFFNDGKIDVDSFKQEFSF